MFGWFSNKLRIPTPDEAFPGREEPMTVPSTHYVLGNPLEDPYPDGTEQALFGMGCFWGAERLYWKVNGVYTTAVGYSGGHTKNPTYQEVCSGMTGHSEVVLVVFEPDRLSYDQLLRLFWENHDPTQGMRQGNDIGTQYRSSIYFFGADQRDMAVHSRDLYQVRLSKAGLGSITTEIAAAPPFYFAEEYHQQYLAKNPHGYCGLGGTGVSCPGELSKDLRPEENPTRRT